MGLEKSKFQKMKVGACYFDVNNLFQCFPNVAVEERVEVIQKLYQEIQRNIPMDVSVARTYGDFHALHISQKDLANLDIVPRHVEGDPMMQMVVDLTKSVYTRDDIHMYVICSGDQTYGPVEQNLCDNGKKVFVYRTNAKVEKKVEFWDDFCACFHTEWERCSAVGVRFKTRTGQNLKKYRLEWLEKGLIQTRGSSGLFEVSITKKNKC